MPKNYLAVLVPLTDQEQRQAASRGEGRNQARMSVWNTVTKLLRPYLGQEFSTFMPAVCPWGHPLMAPFGVALGAPETGLLLHFYALARKEQSDTVDRYYAMIEGEGKPVAEFSPCDGLTVTVMAVNMADLSQTPAIKWYTQFMKGKLSAEACLYYYGFGSTHVERDLEKHILSHVEEYALCAVELDR